LTFKLALRCRMKIEMTTKAQTSQLMTIGEVARTAGVATPTLRYYEQEGLLSPTARSRAGYRLYDVAAVEQLRFIRSAQAVGFTLDDIRSDLHMHTVASDGKNTIEEMARAALTRGYEYIAICDHSKSSTIANGLSVERMTAHIEEIREVDKQVRGITILVGTECDILPDGSLDYPDDLLAQCDWVVASVHSAMGKAGKSKKLSPTERTIAAIENPNVCVIGHPTGRLIQRRAAMEMDIRQVIEAAARTGTFLEINANWMRCP